MLTLNRKLRQLLPTVRTIMRNQPNIRRFSESKKPLFSLEGLFRNIRNTSARRWRMLGAFTCAVGCSIFLQWFSEWYTLTEYPQNVFINQITHGTDSFTEIKPEILISVHGIVNYSIYFIWDGKKCVVRFSSNFEGFNECLRIIKDSMNSSDVEYKSTLEHMLVLPYYIAAIVSSVFVIWFIVRSTGMSSSSAKDKQGLTSQILNQKKKFEVINNTGVKFADVAGLDQSKMEVMEFVDFLKNPAKYKELGARIPKGVLLGGPPGTGKTMLAKACAGEAGVPFIPTSGSDFVEVFVGVGASRIRDLFETARSQSPSIIFIDEIDAVGRKRSGSEGSHDERDSTLNQILVEMDGFGLNSNIIVMAATNKLNLLDPALIRPGRFDRIVEVNLPDLEGRRQIFNVHLDRIALQKSKSKDDYARRLASLTPSFSGADIANLCNQAAILAGRHNKDVVDSHDFEMATERIIGGIEKHNLMSQKEKKIVAVHESGHAVVAWFLESASPLLKLTIIPRSKGALGFAQYFSNQNKLQTRTELVDRICFILGGRCAEEHFFGSVTNGASDDLRKAYQIAHNVVIKLGMSERVGYVGYTGNDYLRPYSNTVGSQIDRQIMNLLAECTARTRALVKKYDKQIHLLSEELFLRQTLTIRDIRQILGEREFKTHDEYEKYLQIEREQTIV